MGWLHNIHRNNYSHCGPSAISAMSFSLSRNTPKTSWAWFQPPDWNPLVSLVNVPCYVNWTSFVLPKCTWNTSNTVSVSLMDLPGMFFDLRQTKTYLNSAFVPVKASFDRQDWDYDTLHPINIFRISPNTLYSMHVFITKLLMSKHCCFLPSIKYVHVKM